jgi:hypothetical protein
MSGYCYILFPFSSSLLYIDYSSFSLFFLFGFQNGVLYRGVSPDVLMLDQRGYLQVGA